jgi:pyruvate/2-oxoglutarate dehydrogenase complex dihydrolipoamide acyltransferase (E2) component
METAIILPDLGAGRVTLSSWFAEAGETVYEGDRLVEVVMAGATFDVAAPATGRLVEKRAYRNDVLRAGQVLGIVRVDRAS